MIEFAPAVIPSAGQLFGMAALIASVAALVAAIRLVNRGPAGSREAAPVANSIAPKSPLPAEEALPAKSNLPAAAPVPAVPETGAPDEETLVILAAAVAAVMGAAYRIVAVAVPKTISSEPIFHIWSLEGRRQIYSSHKIR